jgi:hypothetical protein
MILTKIRKGESMKIKMNNEEMNRIVAFGLNALTVKAPIEVKEIKYSSTYNESFTIEVVEKKTDDDLFTDETGDLKDGNI